MSDTKRNDPAGNGAESNDQQGSGSGIDPTAELATVGAVVQAAESVQDAVLSIVRDDDFSDPRCKFVIEVIREMRAAHVPVDPMLLLGYVNHHGLLEVAPRMTLSVWLAEIASSAPCPAFAHWYAEVVVEAAARRTAHNAAARTLAAAEGGSLADLLAVVADELAAVTAAAKRVGGGVNV